MKRSEPVIKKAVYLTGVVTTVLIIAILSVVGLSRLEYIVHNPTIRRGIVTGYSYDDGHTTYVDYVFGNWTFRKACGDGKDHFYLQVTNDRGVVDYWEVNQDDYAAVTIGEAVARDHFNEERRR